MWSHFYLFSKKENIIKSNISGNNKLKHVLHELKVLT